MREEAAQPQALVRDSDWLVAGQVDGWGAVEVPAFTATRYELLVIFKHWVETQIDIVFSSWVISDALDSRERRMHAFAGDRGRRIEEALADKEAVRAAVKEAYDAYGEKQILGYNLAWKVYREEATEQEERQFRQEQEQWLGGGGSADTSPGACRACGNSAYWMSVHSTLVCGVCHPPADYSLVVESVRGEG